MNYGDLVQFEPIESVKQLRASASESQANEDVRTYVISESLRDTLTGVVIPQLRFDNAGVDHRGLLLVATYGTGKTHLMSVIAGVAEDADRAKLLTDPVTAEHAQHIAGRFRVVRVEIGAVRMGLRDILTRELTRGLAALGVSYEFAPIDQVANNKDSLAEMMTAFEAAYPDQGLLLVIDELLDYLRTRRDAEIILDLGFLREMGEFCQGSRFRVIAGVQQMLWDNPRFANVQDEIRRVRERYQQFRILRDDVAYVVGRRLLGKNETQREFIRNHLSRFAPGFESMGARLEDFVELFPVHPAYLRTFENLTIVEKRRILETLSGQMKARLDDAVPDDDPGLICFDEYRADLDSDPANRTIPEVKQVLDRARVLRDRVSHGLRTRSDIPPALRIIDALTVHRLTTEDIDAPIGLTVGEIRDDLCLLPPGTPELDPDFIASTIETVIDEIRLAVGGQFLSVNSENGQVYLDLKKDIDYEQQIEQRATTLDDEALDNAYYRALERVLEVNDDPYVAGYRIWQYELLWASRKVTRLGYLFMGAPNERSTAQPPRDFYIYFLQPYSPHAFTDERKADEVFLRLTDPDDTFTTALRRYAGAAHKAVETTIQHKAAFEQRRDSYLNQMVDWLRKNMATNMVVTYNGEERPFGQWLTLSHGSRRSVKDQVDAIASHLLEAHFELRYPGYPVFPQEITRANLAQAVQASLQVIGRRRDSNLGRIGLSGLQLTDINGAITADGPFARHLLEQIAAGGGKAVNRNGLLTQRDLGVWTWGPWHMEPAWLVVVAAALAYLGKAEIGLPSGTVGPTQLDRLADTPLSELEQITHITPPAGLDVARLRRVATLIDVVPGVVTENLESEVVAQLLSKAETVHSAASDARNFVLSNPRLWGEELFDSPTHRVDRLDALITVTGDVRNRTNAGKMRNLAFDDEQLTKAEQGRRELARVNDLKAVRDRLGPVIDYLARAASILGPDDPHSADSDALRARLRDVMRAEQIDKTAAATLHTDAERLRANYRRLAVKRHQHDRLDAAGDAAKMSLIEGQVWRDLAALSQVSIIPAGRFAALESKLVAVVTCKAFRPDYFDADYICPDCKYQPTKPSGQSASATISEIAQTAHGMLVEFFDALADSLAEPELAEGLRFLNDSSRRLVEAFIKARTVPGGVTQEFVTAANQLLQRFEIINVDRDEMWGQVMGGATSLTPDELSARFARWLDQRVIKDHDRARVRIVPKDGG